MSLLCTEIIAVRSEERKESTDTFCGEGGIRGFVMFKTCGTCGYYWRSKFKALGLHSFTKEVLCSYGFRVALNADNGLKIIFLTE